jgi:hypothetical protein
MSAVRLFLLVIVANGLLLLLVREANFFLTPLGLTFFPAGLLVIFAAWRLPLGLGLGAVLLTGLLWGARLPVPLGLMPLFLGLAFGLLFHLRRRFRGRDPLTAAWAAAAANALLLLAWTVVLWPGEGLAPYAARFLGDLLLSEALVFPAAYWFVSLQESVLLRWGPAPPAEEEG